MREGRREEQAPLKYDIPKPDHESGDHPDDRNSYEHRLPEKQTERKKKIANITHPEHVIELMNPQVVHGLREEEDERKESEQSEAKIGIFN